MTASTTFSDHNVVLDDGTETLPGNEPVEHKHLFVSTLRMMHAICPPVGADGQRRTVIDLGCLEGGWTVGLARAGYDALGIEGRRVNFDNCEVVRRGIDLPNLRFAHDDVRNVESHGEFDIVFCFGLLYHLDEPAAYLEKLARVTRRMLVLHTHYAPTHRRGCVHGPGLGEWAMHEGRIGRWFREWPEGADEETVEGQRWASIGNPASFWLEKKQLLQALVDAGFSTIMEQYDWLGNIQKSSHLERESSSLFVALPPGPGA